MNFRFNQENFILGLLVGWATAYALYQARHVIGGIRRSFSEQAESAQKYAARSADGRYINDLLAFCRQNHMAGKTIELNKVIIEPRFLAPPPFIAPPDDDVSYDVFQMIPKIHEMPYLYAAFNVNTVSIEDLSYGERAIALLGLPGSGRTTALQAIAMWSLSEIDFKPEVDNVAARLEEEEAALNPDERQKRMKERAAIEERARSRLAEESGRDYDPEMERSGGAKGLSPFKQLMPIYVHLANVTPELTEFGVEVDPAEPLIRAVQFQVGRVTAQALPLKMYERLNKGRALVMLDGFDDLSPEEQEARIPWLRAFIQQYRNNFLIVTGPATGYGQLTRMGLVPVFMRPLNDLRVEKLVNLWADHWATISGSKQRRGETLRPPEELIEILKEDMRSLSFFDVIAKIRGYFSDECDEVSTLSDWTAAYVNSFGVKAEHLSKLSELAALHLNEGMITIPRLQEIAIAAAASKHQAESTSTPAPVAESMDEAADGVSFDDLRMDDDLYTYDDEPQQAVVTEEAIPESIDSLTASFTPSSIDKQSDKELESSTGLSRKDIGDIRKREADFVSEMEKLGILVRYRKDTYLFKHHLLASYLAGLSLKQASDEVIAEKSFISSWYYALAYAAAHTPIDAAVEARMAQPPDVLYQTLLEPARWLAYAVDKVDWKNAYLRELAGMFIAPNQYPLVRERIMSALVGTRDQSVVMIFEKALNDPDPDIRRLGCLGVGVMREERAVGHLAPRLQDQEDDVRLAAGVSLGAIGTDEAYEELITALTSGSEQLRQAVSETFAAIPEEGYPVLYDAINSDDMMLRRAAIFGLRRVNAPWAMVTIYRAFLEDTQWYVRSAAQQVFLDLQQSSASDAIRLYPDIESIEWVREWLTSLGEAGAEINPNDALIEILNDEDPVMKAVSALAIGQLGMADKLPNLYMTLRDELEVVRDSAHRAIADLQLQMGVGLPAPA